MADVWTDVVLTILVTLITVFADWLASRLISTTRMLARIRHLIDRAASGQGSVDEIKKALDSFYANRPNLIWGSDLAAIAFSLDIAILGIWITSPGFFPFFSRWNSSGTSREIPIWLILLSAHFILLLVSIAFKHLQTDTVEFGSKQRPVRGFRSSWIAQNGYLVASNIVGFVSLLSSFIIITNAI